MALTPSNMLELGTKAPNFTLQNVVNNEWVTLDDHTGFKAYLVLFICNHCPYVLHINDELVKIGLNYQKKEVGIYAISSNDIDKYPQDAPDKMKTLAIELGYPFPYLFDPTQEVAKAYDAACTPDFYVFDQQKILKYRGRLCPSKPNSTLPVTGSELRSALDAVLSLNNVNPIQYPSMGCNIKWK